jgi:hypothetical protein
MFSFHKKPTSIDRNRETHTDTQTVIETDIERAITTDQKLIAKRKEKRDRHLHIRAN